MNYRAFFGLAKDPFAADLALDAILKTKDLASVHERIVYTVGLGAIALVTGEVGAGKSTALRWVAGQFHPSKYGILWVTATSGSILELYRQLLAELDIHSASFSRAVLTGQIRAQITNLVHTRKQQPVLIIDEASLLRLDVFAELHTLTQFEGDSEAVPADDPRRPEQPGGKSAVPHRRPPGLKNRCPQSPPGGQSRCDGALHRPPPQDCRLQAVPPRRPSHYRHPLGFGRPVPKAKHLARGGLLAAASEKSQVATAEHIRLASTDQF